MPEEAPAGDAAAFAAALSAALPPGVRLGQADPSRLHPLLPGEALPRVVPARLAEFSAGRAAARAALGLPAQALPRGPDRAPQWPRGWQGSITHCRGLCLAVAGPSDTWQGLGLDAEPEAALDAALWDTILRPDEPAQDGWAALAHFVAKEAAYKAQYALSRRLIGFHDLRLDIAQDRFRATFTTEVPPLPRGHVLQGRMIRAGGYLGALVALAAG